VIAIIFLRLWYLEVLSGDRYLAEAQNNQVREFRVQAPRGRITDRDGAVLVDNRTALELQVKETELPETAQARTHLFQRLGEVAGMAPERIRKEVRRQTRLSPASPVSLKRDVPVELVYFLRENQMRFPGVSIERVYVRRYPMGATAAHLLGYVREVNEDQLEDPRYETLEPGDTIGQDGVEYAYDSLLRGVNGATRVKVDATGTPTGQPLTEREPAEGNDLVLTIDDKVQQAGEAAVSRYGLPAAFVAMRVDNGEVLGLGSTPTYDPAVLARPTVPQSVYEQIFGDPDDPESTLAAPAVNRAIAGAYPTGSTFKPITALAALDSGNLSTGEIINDDGAYEVGSQVFRNAGDAVFGPLALRQALQVSSDVFFYTLGARMNVEDGEGGPLQVWAKRLGIGEATGIDVPGERAGLLPTPEWRNELYELAQEPDSPAGEQVVPDDVYEYGAADRPWSVGDNINLAVGQGDLQADPLQMAVAYATIANGGSVVRPHVGLRVEDPAGRVIQEIEPAPRHEVEVDTEWRQTILEGLRDAAMSPGGTSYNVFGGFPVEIAGKTGTAERGLGRADQSWYVALAPYDDPKYVVAVTIEGGGFGADAAAPATSEILTELLDVKPAKIDEVSTGEAAVYE
jgi:penicillin-binding protein 2